MDTLYIKVGKKYKKYGTTFGDTYHSDGIWLFQSHEHSKEGNNLSLRLCELPPKADMQKYIKAFMTKESVIKALIKIQESQKCYSNNDMAEIIINEVYLESNKGSK